MNEVVANLAPKPGSDVGRVGFGYYKFVGSAQQAMSSIEQVRKRFKFKAFVFCMMSNIACLRRRDSMLSRLPVIIFIFNQLFKC